MKERIAVGSIGYCEALEETFSKHQRLWRRVRLLASFGNSFWKDKAHQDRFNLAQAVYGTYKKRNTPAYYAVLYLITSDESLFRCTADCVTKKKIDFQYALPRNVSLDLYALFKTAKSIYTSPSNISIDELTDQDLFNLENFRLVINAMLICRYGLAAIYLK